jgi:glutamate-1-semialdehyde 2,1-aminomutase
MSETVQIKKSHRLFERAKQVIPGGVNSPARSCSAVGCSPIFIKSADGAHLHDVDGESYVDYVGSWGPMILGHRHPYVMEAIEHALAHGTSFGAPCAAEVEIAELICKTINSIEMVRMVNSGTEATMSALRLARAYTNKSILIKFDGCYHGHGDSFLINAGSGLATLGIASSPGVPEEIAKLTISLPYNNLEAVTKAFKEHKDIAAIIVEPIVGNAGLILPKPKFLEGLRELCTTNGALLIFDEVMTGFRVSKGGAQELYKIKPDLTCLGKIIGGGLPVGAYGGKKEIMEMIAPVGKVYQAGTLSGNPLAMAAGLAQLKLLQSPFTYKMLESNTNRLVEGLKAIKSKKIPLQVAHTNGMITVFFTKEPVTDLESAKSSDTEMFAKVWRHLLKEGIYWPPSQFEAAFMSTVHSKQDIDKTIQSFETAIANLS